MNQDRTIWLIVGVLVVLFFLGIPASILLLGVTYDYTLTTVALGGALLGLISGVLGSFVVLRQESLLGDALSHAALPGIAIAFLVFGRDIGYLLLGAAVAGGLAVLFIRAVTSTTRIKQDAAMGMTLTAFFAIGLAFLTYIQSRPDASQAGLDQFIFGQAAAIVRQDVILIGAAGLIALIFVIAFWKEFKLITFDIAFARANGYPVRFLEGLLSTLIVVAIVLGLQLAGVILMVGLLIAPAVAARQWTRKLDQMVVLAAVFGAFAGVIGAVLSAISEGLPTGPLIIVVAFATVVLSLLFAPERGVVWRVLRQRADRRRFATQNILHDIYQHGLRHGNPAYHAHEGMLITLRGSAAKLGLRQLEQQTLAVADRNPPAETTWTLTPAGVEQAAHHVHNRQLWDIYRRYGTEMTLPEVQADPAEDISTLLPAQAIQQLETKLAAEG